MKRTKKTCKPAASKPAAVPPAVDAKYEPMPDWLYETPETLEYEYLLAMWPILDDNHGDGDPYQQICMTLDEYGSLKYHLTDIRKLKPVTTVASMERGLRRFAIASDDCKAESGPDWLETPDNTYRLETWTAGDRGDVVQEIEVTREEYIALKRHLMTLRSSKRAA